MARVKGRVNGQKVGMEAGQAAQMGISGLADKGVPTGILDPTQVTAAQTAPLQDAVGKAKTAISTAMEKVPEVLRKKAANVSKVVTPTNPQQQKTMFSTVKAITKSNPTTDIFNKDPNAWKNLQRKFGLKEV